MRVEIHPAKERGTTDLGWLQSKHSFSFGEYYNPSRIGFGLLRVINEDIVQAGMGFGTHPHNNMEIVSIVLEGTLEHKDSEGNHGLIPAGDIQKMSAGSGVSHSEFNHSKKDTVHFLQIWVHPKEKNITPSYEQKSFPSEARKNKLLPVVSGKKSKDVLYIHQDAAFFLGDFDRGITVSHRVSSAKHGLYVFVMEGAMSIDGKKIEDGDAAAITDTDSLDLITNKKTKILVIEVPL